MLRYNRYVKIKCRYKMKGEDINRQFWCGYRGRYGSKEIKVEIG